MDEKGQDRSYHRCQAHGGCDSRHHHGQVDQPGQLSWASSSWLTIPMDVFHSCWCYLCTERTAPFPGVRYMGGLLLRSTWLWFTSLVVPENHMYSLERNYREPHLLRFWLTRFQMRIGICLVKESPVSLGCSVRTEHHWPSSPSLLGVGHGSSCICITWELIRNASSQAPPHLPASEPTV